jgi:uracil-DNA glycosylase
VRELTLLADVRVIVCLGAFAWDDALRLRAALGEPAPRPRPRFGHGAELLTGRWPLLGSFHPSQQNTFTGKLSAAMTDAVLARARELAGLDLHVLRDRSRAVRTKDSGSTRRPAR